MKQSRYHRIYSGQAADYHRLITPEDVDGNLLPAIENVTSLRGKRILDLATGTGRLPRLFGTQAAQVVGIDLHSGMLRENKVQRTLANGKWLLARSDIRELPVSSNWVDVVTVAWAMGHFIRWYGDTWQTQIERVLHEALRVATSRGAIIIIETLSTGSITPQPPSDGLAAYYAWLESEWGFRLQTIQTDYQFPTVEDAVNHMAFFFGADLAQKIRQNGWSRVPEWTGVWSKRL